jgi:phosphopantothenoylcysteine decarboxylase/phosphopantothenate--cysteine ligase
MRDAVFAHLEPATAIIKCAAVADYRPAHQATEKIKKTGEVLTFQMEPTADILAELGQKRGNRLLVGFAAETQNLREYAAGKIKAKNCDMIVANLVGVAGSGFEADENEVLLALKDGQFIEVPKAPKLQIAHRILDELVKLRA